MADSSGGGVKAAALAVVSPRPPPTLPALSHPIPIASLKIPTTVESAADCHHGCTSAQGAAAVAVATGRTSSASDSTTPTGLHFIGLDADEKVQSRSELMEAALKKLKDSRGEAAASSSPRAGMQKCRVLWANETWLKLYALMDYNNDHVLHTNEIIRGVQMVKHFWKMCEAKLWPVACLNRDQCVKAQWKSGEQLYSKLDDVQAFAVALADGEQLSWSKSTHFLQELDVHPGRQKYNRKRILTVLCDEYLSAIVIPNLQSWMEVFDRVDWNRSRTIGFLELKQGMSACSSPEVGLLRNMVDVRTVVNGARERILKDKFFRVATSLFERTEISRLCAEPNQTSYTCLQVGSRHRKVWDRIATNKGNFATDVESIYEVLGNALSCDDVDSVEQCMSRLRNRICLYLKQLRQHITWLKHPLPLKYEGCWASPEGNALSIKSIGVGLNVTYDGRTHPAQGVCAEYFTVSWAAWGFRRGLTTFRRVSESVLEESLGHGAKVRSWNLSHAGALRPSASPIRAPSALRNSTPTPKKGGTGRRRRQRDAGWFPFDASGEAARPGLLAELSQVRLTSAELEAESVPAFVPEAAPEPAPESAPEPAQVPELPLQELTQNAQNASPRTPCQGVNRSRGRAAKQTARTASTPRSRRLNAQAALECVPLLQGLSQDRKQHMLNSFVVRLHSRGDTIVLQGASVDAESEFSIIQEGTVSVEKNNVVQCVLGSGDCFGELALISGNPRSASIVATSESVRLLSVGQHIFRKALMEMPTEGGASKSEGWDHALDKLADMKHEMELIRGSLWAQQVQKGAHLLDADQLDIMSLEEAVTDLNDLAAAAWRSLKVCNELNAMSSVTSTGTDCAQYLRLYMTLAKFVRRYRARKAKRVAIEFAPHQRIVTRIQSRIRGFLARRRVLHDQSGVEKIGKAAADADVRGVVQSEVEFWDWPRVLEHCYVWHADKVDPNERRSSLFFPEILLQRTEFAKKMHSLKQALHGWNELFTIMDSDGSGKVNPDELKEALFAFSCMGLIAEPPKMQPLDQDHNAFTELLTGDSAGAATPRSLCSRMRTRSHEDACGSVGPFSEKQVILLGEEGVPMLGCWGIDLEFEYSPADLADDGVAFHCLTKSYAGDAIVVRTSSTQGMLTVFVAPKAVFDEETETKRELNRHFESLEPRRYLCEITFQESEGPRCWYRLLIVGQPAQTELDSELNKGSNNWNHGFGEQDDWDTLSLCERTPREAEMSSLLQGVDKPAPNGLPSWTPRPMQSPKRTPRAKTPRLGQRRGSLTEIVAPGSSTPKTNGRSRRLSVQANFSPLKTPPNSSRPKSRRLSIVSMQGSESDGWSEDEDESHAVSVSPTMQKLHVNLMRSNRDGGHPDTLLQDHTWQGHFNFFDCYSVGNTYDVVCGRAFEDMNWSIGRIRNFCLHGLDHEFMAAINAMPSRGSLWLVDAIKAAVAHREGRFMHEAAQKAGINIAQRDDDEQLIRQSSRNLMRGVSGILTPRGPRGPMMRSTSSRHLPASPFGQSPRTPHSVLPSPFRSPSPSPSPAPVELRHRSSYRTLADKLMNSKPNNSQAEKSADTIETQNQPPGTLLWIKYQLVSVHAPIECEELRDGKIKRVERPGLVWRNKWETDHCPGFPWSNDLVFREDPNFLQDKARRTQRLIRAAFKALTDDFVKGEQYWRIDGNNADTRDMQIDGAKFFLVRGDIARRDPGLNSMFSGQQVKHARRAVQRTRRVNAALLHAVIGFFILPPRECYHIIREACRCCSKSSLAHSSKSTAKPTTATKTILSYIFRRQRQFPRAQLLLVTGIAWLGCVLPLIIYLFSEVSREHTHGIEIFVNTAYYIWATLCVATVVCSEVRGVKGHVTYTQAALKSEISSKSCSMTKIIDGITVTTSAMAIVQMVCRKHLGEDEEEEEEEEEEENGMDLSLKLLRWFWKQENPSAVLPWLADQMQHDDELSSMSDGQLNRMLVFEFQMKDPPRDKNDWKFNLNITMQGIQSELDLGKTNWKGRLFVGMLAVLHSSMGILHRAAFRKQAAFGERGIDVLGTVGGMVCNGVASYIVYAFLFDIGLTWWMVFKFFKQTHSVIIVEEAIRDKLPCYMDLRTAGNLGSWYSARCYLQEECENLCFAHKDQLPIAIALVFCAGLSVNALTNYFIEGDVAEAQVQSDFSQNPGILITLYNLVVVGALLMNAMLALEKINMETSVLLRKMNKVSVELGKSLEDSVYSRLSDDDRNIWLTDLRRRLEADGGAGPTAAAAAAAGAAGAGASSGGATRLAPGTGSQLPPEQSSAAVLAKLRAAGSGPGLSAAENAMRLLELDEMVTELQVREKLMMEQQFLLSIMQELRDTKSTKKIFGFAVDRNMLAKLFAGIGTCIYIMLKDYLAAALGPMSGFTLLDTGAEAAAAAAEAAAGSGAQ